VDLIIFGLLIVLVVVKQPSGIMGILSGIAKRRSRRANLTETPIEEKEEN
jgi:branched-chain amino acid transport system permease protein